VSRFNCVFNALAPIRGQAEKGREVLQATISAGTVADRADIAKHIAVRLTRGFDDARRQRADLRPVSSAIINGLLPVPLATKIASALPHLSEMTAKRFTRERKYVGAQMDLYGKISCPLTGNVLPHDFTSDMP
jgi:hypothetical protein